MYNKDELGTIASCVYKLGKEAESVLYPRTGIQLSLMASSLQQSQSMGVGFRVLDFAVNGMQSLA